MLGIVALIVMTVYLIKARDEKDVKQKKKYRKRANIWAGVTIAIIALNVLLGALSSAMGSN